MHRGEAQQPRLPASMRPPEFTGGNPRPLLFLARTRTCFNEAAGIHRRKQGAAEDLRPVVLAASMRPPEFTGGNSTAAGGPGARTVASMRPPEFTGGNDGDLLTDRPHPNASMRPPEFTGGNHRKPDGTRLGVRALQ